MINSETTQANMGNEQSSSAKYSEVEMPPSHHHCDYPLQVIKISASGGGRLSAHRPLPKKVVLKIRSNFCEVWAKGAGDDDSPLDRWALCNIISWGTNHGAVRIVVVSEPLIGSQIVRIRTTYEFQTSDGEEIVTSFKAITDTLAAELREATASRLKQQNVFDLLPNSVLEEQAFDNDAGSAAEETPVAKVTVTDDEVEKFEIPKGTYVIVLDDSLFQRKMLTMQLKTYFEIEDKFLITYGATKDEIIMFESYVRNLMQLNPKALVLLICDQNLDYYDRETSTKYSAKGTALISQLCAQLGNLEQNLLTVVRSANDSKEDVEQYMKCADGFLSKMDVTKLQLQATLAPLWYAKFGARHSSKQHESRDWIHAECLSSGGTAEELDKSDSDSDKSDIDSQHYIPRNPLEGLNPLEGHSCMSPAA